MSLVTRRLGNKLREYLKELEKITEEARGNLPTLVVLDRRQYGAVTWELKKTATLVGKLLSHIRGLQGEIEKALLVKEPTKIEIDSELSDILDSADRAEVQVEVVLAEIEAKLSHFNEIKDNLPLPVEAVAKEKTKKSNTVPPSTRTKKVLSTEEFCEEHLVEDIDSISILSLDLSDGKSTNQVTNTVLESTECSKPTEVPQCDFKLRRFYSGNKEFKQFWTEFHKTVEKSPLEPIHKFAALRGLVRGAAYRVFLDLNYHCEKDYYKALTRLSEKYSKQMAELQAELLEQPVTPVEPEITDTTPVEPAITDTTPVEPAITDTTPVEPAITDTTPVEPAITDTTPVEPEIIDTTPVEPAITDTTPVEPEIIDTTVEPAITDTTPVEPAITDTTPVEPAITDTTPSDTNKHRWSDDYFFTKYCKNVPNYQKPDRDLLVRAIQTFLNFYILGPDSAPTTNFANIWYILLHGVKFEDQYIMDVEGKGIFGTDEETTFEDVQKPSKEALIKYAPSLIAEKDPDESKPNLWKWKYSTTESGTKINEVISSKTVKEWYTTCWTKIESCDDDEFQDWVKYFALLSMVLMRVVVKSPESIEKYVALPFNRIFRVFCQTHFMPNAVPPHSGVHKLVRKVEFKKSQSNFRTYLTYLVGCYAFSDGGARKRKIRDFLNAGCLLTFKCTGTGSIYWLRKAAERKQMKTENLLQFFLIDPAMEEQVKKINNFMETYRKEVTWWWARFYQSRTLKEISTANCPPFAYASFIIGVLNEAEIRKSRDYPQFSRFLNDGKSTGLYGKNLGMALRHIVNEWNMTPLSPLTKGLYKRIELKKCTEKY